MQELCTRLLASTNCARATYKFCAKRDAVGNVAHLYLSWSDCAQAPAPSIITLGAESANHSRLIKSLIRLSFIK